MNNFSFITLLKYKWAFYLCFIFCFLLIGFHAQAGSITSAASGNWTATASWSGGNVPSAGDTVIIGNGHTINITTSQTVVNVTLSGSGAINLSATGASLNLSGDFKMNGSSSILGNSSSRLVNVAGNFSVTGGASIIIQNIALNVIGTFYNAGTVLLNTGSSAAKYFGNFINNGVFTNSSNSVPMTVGGDFTNNGTFTSGTGRLTFTGSSNNIISGSAGTTAFGGGITVNKGIDQSSILEVTSNMTMSNGGLILSNGTFKMSSASTFTPFTADPNIPSGARLWNNGGTMNSSANINWTLNGAIRLDAGIINIGTAANNRISPTTGSTIEVNGGTLNVAGRISPSQSSYTWTFLMTAGQVNLGTIGNTSSSNETFMMDNNNDVFAISGGTLSIVNGFAQAYLNRSTNGAGFTGGVFAIGNATTTSGSVMRFESTQPLYNLLINAPGSTVQIATALQIADGLTLTAGNVDLNNQTLTLGLSAASPGTLVRSTGFLYGGGFRRWFNAGTFSIGDDKGLFPMGTSSGDYRPLWLAYSSSLPNTGSARVTHTPTYPSTFNNATHQDASWGNTIQGVSNSYWTISLTSMVFQGTSGMIRFGGTGFGNNTLTDLNATLNSSAIGTHAAATNLNTSLEVNRTGLTSGTIANSWRIGTRNTINSPLPITFVDFTAETKGKEVLLNWETLTEKNSDFFTVEKSLDGIHFNAVLKVPASGNTSTKRNYSATDVSENNDIIYYRLKQTDLNGSNEYFKIIVVSFNNNGGDLLVFPNPTKADVISLSNLYDNLNSIELINELGVQVYFSQERISKIDLTRFPIGVYYLKVNATDKSINKKIIIEN